MKPAKGTMVIYNPIFTIWIDDEGIVNFISLKHASQTSEETKTLFSDINKISKGNKSCMLMDLTNFQMPSKESRDLGASELPKMVKAIAFLSDSVLGAWVANIFFAIKKQPYPVKMFSNEKEARIWLREFL